MPTASGQLTGGTLSSPTPSWELNSRFPFLSSALTEAWDGNTSSQFDFKKSGATRQPHARSRGAAGAASEADWGPVPPGRRKVAWLLRKSQRAEFPVTSDKPQQEVSRSGTFPTEHVCSPHGPETAVFDRPRGSPRSWGRAWDAPPQQCEPSGRAVVLKRGRFCPRSTPGNIWRRFGLSQLSREVAPAGARWVGRMLQNFP